MGTKHLGYKSSYVDRYNPSLLDSIPRKTGREECGFASGARLPFRGYDLWNLYELSWLNSEGKPQVALGHLRVPYDSPNLVESKSLKLYLNSFNQTSFESYDAVHAAMVHDISECADAKVTVELLSIHAPELDPWPYSSVKCIDQMPLREIPDGYDPSVLRLGVDEEVDGVWCTHLMRSLCPVTLQPDWATVFFIYKGVDLDWPSVLAYICGYRTHKGFHEQCVEQMFADIVEIVPDSHLSVYACFNRRGGIDICPFRSNFESAPSWHEPLLRQ